MTFCARVPADLSYRELVGTMVREVCRRVEAEVRAEGVEWRVVSAFNEAFNNAAIHAAVGREVGVRVRVEPKRLVLELTDRGPGFDLERVLAAGPPPAALLDRGGMGLFIIRGAMSSVRYARGAMNKLTMVLNFNDTGARGGTEDGVLGVRPVSNDEGSPC